MWTNESLRNRLSRTISLAAVVVAFGLALLASRTPAPVAAAGFTIGQRVVVNTAALNVRSAPGLGAQGGTEGVGEAATRGVVGSIFAVLIADVLLVGLIQALRPFM